ncbi:MAG: HAMP domain-containing histidine kinase [Nannocystaceae bacterium]|nr:HAMP domain-containing histidine kinase [Nannocystaceae bacterium]
MRRLLPTIAVLGVGLLLLLWGLARLEGIIVEERHETKARLIQARQTLAQYARRALLGELASALRDAEPDMARAAEDPLIPAQNLLLVDRALQVLPRHFAFKLGDDSPGRELYLALRTGDDEELEAALDLDPDAPWAQRLALQQSARSALRAGDDDGVRRAVRDILDHRARWVLPSTNDIPATLALLDDLLEYATPHEQLLSQLLRDGMGRPPAVRREGLQRQLLSHRDRFTEADFRFLATRVQMLSERAGIPSADFEAEAIAEAKRRIVMPAGPGAPALLDAGRWYVESRQPTRTIGLAVSLSAYLDAVQQEMRDRGLLAESDGIALPSLGPMIALSDLEVVVTAPRLDEATEAADHRFSLKTTFVALTAGLALIIAMLAIVLQRRSARFVELKSDFVAAVSHELRTPLASIRLMAETLERRTQGIARVKDYPTRIVREADELAFLVENILSFNRLDKGRWTPRRTDVDISEVLDEIVENLPSYGFSDVELHTDGIDGLTLSADRELLKLMLRNLIKNACTYNERKPIVLRIAAKRDGRGVTMTVADNGVGIEPELYGRVFDDFERGAGVRARGSGLGLSICRKSVEAHGGRITIATSGPEGTTFEIRFPATMVLADVSQPS